MTEIVLMQEPSQPVPVAVAILGVCFVIVATLTWRWAFVPAFAIAIVPLMLLGILLCAIAIWSKRRRLAVVGLLTGVTVVALSICFVMWQAAKVLRRVSHSGMNIAQYVMMASSAQGLVEIAETSRLSDGAARDSVDLTTIPAPYNVDAWGRAFVYQTCETCERGYRFVSLGPDGQLETADDVDMLSLSIEGAFELPANRRPSR
jgi:hypothetical protein